VHEAQRRGVQTVLDQVLWAGQRLACA
jgi:hypothetical protein